MYHLLQQQVVAGQCCLDCYERGVVYNPAQKGHERVKMLFSESGITVYNYIMYRIAEAFNSAPLMQQ